MNACSKYLYTSELYYVCETPKTRKFNSLLQKTFSFINTKKKIKRSLIDWLSFKCLYSTHICHTYLSLVLELFCCVDVAWLLTLGCMMMSSLTSTLMRDLLCEDVLKQFSVPPGCEPRDSLEKRY